MSNALSIAIVGSTTLIGEAFKQQLGNSGISMKEIRLIASSNEEVGQITECNGEASVLVEFDSTNMDIIFFCDDDNSLLQYSREINSSSPVAVNLAPRKGFKKKYSSFNGFTGNIEKGKNIYQIVHPAITLAQLMLDPIMDAGIETASAFALQPVSFYGKQGITELHEQTVNLMSFQKVPEKIIGQQSSFNHFPAQFKKGKDSRLKKKIDAQVRSLCSYPLSVAIVQVPLFHSMSCYVSVKLENTMLPEEISDRIVNKFGDLISLPDAGMDITALSSMDSSVFHLGHIWKDNAVNNSYWIWGTSDDMLFCTALNGIYFLKNFDNIGKN